VFGIQIDTEWRSDWKWQRLQDKISPLQDKHVLDVGCGSGYHCLRMAGDGAALTLGIEPGLLYVSQFYALRNFIGEIPVHLLPLTLEAFPDTGFTFDTIFSMGVLYHRRSPFDHLLKLKSLMRPDAELILETLILNREDNSVLVPEGRYAQMRNVWFIPTPPVLVSWLKRCGFRNIRCIDITKTTVAEQRPTEWMTYESLPDALHPENPDITVENLPAPCRAIFLCNNG
jgi:tRNA (mo5U34)-methyltransferase